MGVFLLGGGGGGGGAGQHHKYNQNNRMNLEWMDFCKEICLYFLSV